MPENVFQNERRAEGAESWTTGVARRPWNAGGLPGAAGDRPSPRDGVLSPAAHSERRSEAEQLRVAFLGQRTYFESCVLEDPAAGIEPAFVDLRPSASAPELAAALAAQDPDVVVAFRPDLVPAGTLDGLRARTLGWLTEPLPCPGDPAPHPDLVARLGALRGIDAAQFDRIVCFSPGSAAAAEEVVDVWRCVPLAVSDRLFAAPRDPAPVPRLLFIGRSTSHREAFLGPIKHDFDVLHLAHGVTGERLARLMGLADVAVNLHNEPYPTFENRVQLSMAAGLLVLSEPLEPLLGLQPGVDHLQATAPWELWELVAALHRAPDGFRAVRAAGRRTAERFRASRVLPRLVRELLADVTLFGTTRRGAEVASAR